MPGDVLHLEEGRVPTDCMLLSAGDVNSLTIWNFFSLFLSYLFLNDITDRLFIQFDKKKSNYIGFDEFISGLAIMCRYCKYYFGTYLLE